MWINELINTLNVIPTASIVPPSSHQKSTILKIFHWRENICWVCPNWYCSSGAGDKTYCRQFSLAIVARLMNKNSSHRRARHSTPSFLLRFSPNIFSQWSVFVLIQRNDVEVLAWLSQCPHILWLCMSYCLVLSISEYMFIFMDLLHAVYLIWVTLA